MKKTLIAIMYFALLCTNTLLSQDVDGLIKKIQSELDKVIKEANIPALRVLLLKDGNEFLLESNEYSQVEINTLDKSLDLFEIGSTSKAFTAMAILKLENENKISMNDNVSKYLNWFRVNYNGLDQQITLNQLLHHTSGIPWKTISKIPETIADNALEQTVRVFIDTELEHNPGTKYEYATINYDILGLIIEKVSGLKFEKYMEDNIFRTLEMNNTSIGIPKDKNLFVKGCKIGFFSAREYDAPVYRGNWPAGYVITNAVDVSKWLKFQMGIIYNSELSPLLEKSHLRDGSVPPLQNPVSSYAAGWNISLLGDGIISHGGLNPNYTSYIGFNPNKKIGVAVLANSNSEYTDYIGNYALKILSEIEGLELKPILKNDDKVYSFISIALIVLILSMVYFIGSIFVGIFMEKVKVILPNKRKLFSFTLTFIAVIPFIYAIYLIPTALVGFDWKTAIVWTPISFISTVILSLIVICLIYVLYLLTIFIEFKNKYKKSIPLIVVLSLMSGLANSLVIFIIINSIYAEIKLIYLLYYFGLVMAIYIMGRKIVQVKLLKVTFDIIYEIRINLIEKIFSTTYQKFEKIDRGRVYATLNNDTNVLGGAANVFVSLITSIITTISAFIYLALISFWPTIMTIVVILIIATLYYFISEHAGKYFNIARDTHNVYMSLLNGMLDGFKELCLNRFKKKEYKRDVESTVDSFRKNNVTADIYFINAMMIGESLLIFVLGFVSFAFPKLFPEIQAYVLMSFLMVLLYLIGPINGILQSIPVLIQLRISWQRIQGFIKGIPSYETNLLADNEIIENAKTLESIKLENVQFEYKNLGEHDKFELGPINFEVRKGEILFIIGGNGSGKTTLANLISGLYEPDSGIVKINDKEIHSPDLGENFSVIFSDYNLFNKLYNVNTEKNKDLIYDYFKKFYLEDKVKLENGAFSTTKLSNGQRKRLALIKCYLEDSPIFLFDEVAADQDPDFKKYFYRDLLPQMKKEGKIIIAITHDDHYFDVADTIIKLDQGKIDMVKCNKKTGL